mgnify:CR=1 FL=1
MKKLCISHDIPKLHIHQLRYPSEAIVAAFKECLDQLEKVGADLTRDDRGQDDHDVSQPQASEA